MAPDDGRIMVAVSGGPDSTALLIVLAGLSRGLGLKLHVAHFDHGLRTREAAKREERFVRGLADSYGVAVTVGRGDVRAVAGEQKLSLEDAARRERYAFLARAATEAGCRTVATGHTASDQAETVLLHLVRGSGLAGLSGMASATAWPFPGSPELRLIRPLLRLSRSDTMTICEDAGVKPLEDESNASQAFRRNRLRNEIMPLLRELNPRVEEALVRLADTAAEDYAFLAARAEKLIEGASEGEQGMRRVALAHAPASMRRYAFRKALERVAGDLQDFGERHLAALERLAIEGKTGDRLDLPREVRAELRREDLVLRQASGESRRLPDEPAVLSVPGSGRLGPLTVAVTGEAPAAGTWVEVGADAVGRRVVVRRRADGDRFQPLGMEGVKKLQDFFVDAHVPRGERDGIPIFESERGIAWVGGLRIAEWARPEASKPTLFLCYEG